jgi:hypothetical protein
LRRLPSVRVDPAWTSHGPRTRAATRRGTPRGHPCRRGDAASATGAC